MRMTTSALAAFLVLLTGAACSDDSVSVVESIAFPSASLAMSLREPAVLFPTFRDANGSIVTGVNARWTSSHPAIVSVDDEGRAFGVALGGPVTITVTAGGRSATMSVSVIPHEVQITPGTGTLALGTTRQLLATAFDFDGIIISVPVTWASTNAAAATVAPTTGIVTTAGVGTTSITASAAGRTATLPLEVGIATPLDGHWVGSATIAGGAAFPVSFDVAFGTIRAFRLTVAVSINFGACTYTNVAASQGVSPIVNSAFAVEVHPSPSSATATTGTVSGTFTAPSVMSGTVTAFRFGPSTACGQTTGIGGAQLSDLPIPTTALAAAKQ